MPSTYNDQISIHTGPIEAGITLRNTDLPENGNMALHVCQDPKKVALNRKQLSFAALPLSRWVLPWQKHTCHIQRVTHADAGKGAWDAADSILETDALYTTEPDLLIGVFTADCLGILILDPSTPLVCAVHSGWKGTAQNILHQTLKKLQEQNLIDPQQVQVYFSPSIQKDSFEIGPEVKEQLLQSGRDIHLDYQDLIEDVPGSDRSYADHQAMNVRVLEQSGIPAENIHPSSMDTKTREDCFSFRRDGRQTGEHFSWAMIRSPRQNEKQPQ